MINKRFIEEAIQYICQEEGFEYQSLSSGWVLGVKNNKKQKYIFGYDFSLNPSSSQKLAGDKFSHIEILEKEKIPVVPGKILFNKKMFGMKKYFTEDQHHPKALDLVSLGGGFPVVVKMNSGTSGRHVYRAFNEKELEVAVETIFQLGSNVLISPYIHPSTEYRVIVLGEEAMLIYKKIQTNTDTLDAWKSNLVFGNSFEIVERTDIAELGIQGARMLGLGFCSVDVLENEKGELLILEVNAGVMMEHFSKAGKEFADRAKEIYRKAVIKMMEE